MFGSFKVLFDCIEFVGYCVIVFQNSVLYGFLLEVLFEEVCVDSVCKFFICFDVGFN